MRFFHLQQFTFAHLTYRFRQQLQYSEIIGPATVINLYKIVAYQY